MFCKNCGQEVDANAVVCTSCGCAPKAGDKFCGNCGVAVSPDQVVCVKCGAALRSVPGSDKKDRTIAALLAILLGGFGAHMFYLGNTQSAVIRLVVALAAGSVTLGLSAFVMGIIGLVEGIIYLTKTDEEFEVVYVKGQKAWF